MNNIINFTLIRNKVINNIKNFKYILLAFSGGLDSTVLLDIIYHMDLNNKFKKKYKKPLVRAIYIQHIISNNNSNNNIFLNHCRKECKKRNIKFINDKIIIENISDGIEASFRKYRYNSLYKNMLKNEVLLTAHNLNDQIETLFLSIKRGSGPTGMSGISMYSKFNNSLLVRPMINIDRNKLNKYALYHNLKWLEDISNNEIKFDRNFLRKKILPLLRIRWPSFYLTSNRSSKICYFQENLINDFINQEFNKIIQSDNSIIFNNLLNMNIIKVFYLLRKWFLKFKIQMPSIKKLYLIWKEIINSKNSSIAKIKINKNKEIKKFKNRIYITNINISICKHTTLFWNYKYNIFILPFNLGIIRKKINFKYKKYHLNYKFRKLNFINFNFLEKKKFVSVVRPPLINEFLSIRFTSVNKLIYLLRNKHGVSLNKIWKMFNIPIWYRNKIPLLFYNDNIITAPGIFITNEGLHLNYKIKLEITWNKLFI
ncbi:MAG: tRNA lysidine(34) synthetase TilS [Candidatus Makana argininalis]